MMWKIRNFKSFVEIKIFWRLRRLEIWLSYLGIKEGIMVIFSNSYSNSPKQNTWNKPFFFLVSFRPPPPLIFSNPFRRLLPYLYLTNLFTHLPPSFHPSIHSLEIKWVTLCLEGFDRSAPFGAPPFLSSCFRQLWASLEVYFLLCFLSSGLLIFLFLLGVDFRSSC